MIIGLAKNNDDKNLEVEEVVTGMYVVRDAYAGEYDFFASSEELFNKATIEAIEVAIVDRDDKKSESEN